MIRTTFQLTPDLYERLREFSFKRRISQSKIVRRALRVYLNRRVNEVPEVR